MVLKNSESLMPKPSAKVSSERKHGSFIPVSTSEMNVRLSPV